MDRQQQPQTPVPAGLLSAGPFSGQVIKTTLTREIVTTLTRPNLSIYQRGNYSPTFVAVNE